MTTDDGRPQQYANLVWQKGWNDIPDGVGVAALSQTGEGLLLVGTMGVLSFDMEDLPKVIKHHQAALRLLEGISDVSTAEVSTESAVGRSEDVRRNRRSQSSS